VFLAILFLGNADASFRATPPTGTAQNQGSSGYLFGPSSTLNRTRCAALYLLPALLGQAQEAAGTPIGFPATPGTAARLSELAPAGFSSVFAFALPVDSFHAHTLWQRPPPSF
jgi:hypothetical protein